MGISCPACCLLNTQFGFFELSFKHVVQFVTSSFNSSYSPGQYIDCLTLLRHFSNLRCSVCRSWTISWYKLCGTIMWVPFCRIPSSMVNSSQRVQYGLISFRMSCMYWGYPHYTMYLSSDNSSLSAVSVWNWFNLLPVTGSCWWWHVLQLG